MKSCILSCILIYMLPFLTIWYTIFWLNIIQFFHFKVLLNESLPTLEEPLYLYDPGCFDQHHFYHFNRFEIRVFFGGTHQIFILSVKCNPRINKFSLLLPSNSLRLDIPNLNNTNLQLLSYCTHLKKFIFYWYFCYKYTIQYIH